mmetsp:Transcript_19948/g.28669  ORF Transcript_19948/g.28669 Transcript_19948/m.28669 type:complete len:142 (-) Transcript_19948:54-479(-)
MRYFSFLLIYLCTVCSADEGCDSKYGTPTRSTGECICKYSCRGKGCRREHGLSWYDYKACPSCECVAYTEEDNQRTEPMKQSNDLNTENENAEPTYIDDTDDIDDIEPLSVFEWLDENSRYLVAGFASFFVVIVVFLFLCA